MIERHSNQMTPTSSDHRERWIQQGPAFVDDRSGSPTEYSGKQPIQRIHLHSFIPPDRMSLRHSATPVSTPLKYKPNIFAVNTSHLPERVACSLRLSSIVSSNSARLM